jgi:Kef-type K+ transport system membrane component KefB
MGEMVAGILLGPSLLGWVAPGISAVLFPAESLGFLNALSQVGLLLFMFLVGLELQPQLLRERGRTAVVTSHASIFVPFLLGSILALFLYPRLSDDSVAFVSFALFMGAAMSITAFPVLARILAERNLLHTKIGTVAIACAAVDDVTGWCVLAGVVLLVRSAGSGASLFVTVGGTAAYVALMIFVVRRFLPKLQQAAERRGGITQGILAMVLVLVLASASATEWLGIHALFGAFVMGAIMPKGRTFVEGITGKLQDLTVVLLLPLFFAFIGLRTSIRLLSGAEMWLFCGAVIAVAILGKLGGSAIAARLSGMGSRESWTIGILMNTRGLIELVLLNIGLELGVLSPTLFTMMVIMALVTTFMTSPLLEWVYFRQFSAWGWFRARAGTLAKSGEAPLR